MRDFTIKVTCEAMTRFPSKFQRVPINLQMSLLS
jgi:hypothetical protein